MDNIADTYAEWTITSDEIYLTYAAIRCDFCHVMVPSEQLILTTKQLYIMSATKIGIWMDHQHAFVTEFTETPMNSTQITNDALENDKSTLFAKGENHKHTKEQHLQAEYYNKIAAIIKRYDAALLFGPTKAKDELFNRLMNDHDFSKVKLSIQHADKMTENQRHAFVRDYFTKHKN